MKLLLISNMYPSEQKPYSGIFVKNQYEEISRLLDESNSQSESIDDSIDIYYMKRTFTGAFGSLWKYLMAFVKFTPYYFKKYDILHLHYFYPLVILCWFYKLFRPSTQIVVTFHGGDINTQVKSGLNLKFFKFLSRCIDLSIAVGKPLEVAVKEKLNHPNTKVLSAGVSHSVFYPGKSNDFQSKKYDFIFVGTFEVRKGVDFIIDAIRRLDNPELRFCFVGSGPLQPELEELSKTYQIEIKSNLSQPEIRELFLESKFHTLPSRSEPFGLVVSEAMFCGVPSIVTDDGGLPEQVQNGANGFISPEISASGVLLTFQRALAVDEAEWYQLSECATKNKDKFSLESVCVEHISDYRALLK